MKDTNTTLVVGLLALLVIALATMLAITYSKTDPVILIGFATMICTGILSFLRTGQASAKIDATENKVQQIKVSVDGKMDEYVRLATEESALRATLAANIVAELKAADLVKVTDANLAAAVAAPAYPADSIGGQVQANSDAIAALQQVSVVQAHTDPVPVVVMQPEGEPVLVEMAVKPPEEGKE